MRAFGDELRLERETRGVSLDALSAQTKVNTRHLLALESGHFHELPGGVFRRGILRAYVKALGLEEAEWLPRFEASVADNARRLGLQAEPEEDAWVTFASNVKKNRVRQRPSTLRRWLGVLVLAILLAVAGWALWHYQLQRLRVGD
jgi:cytoskeletal protein RodZ